MNWQKTLEAVGIPTELAKESNRILQKQAKDPFYQRTEEEQKTIDSGYQILIQNMNRSGVTNNGHSQT